MIIVENPYVSREMADFLVESGTPVLDNGPAWSLPYRSAMIALGDDEFARRINAGERLYTTSEHALNWIAGHVDDKRLLHSIACMKDKCRLRNVIRDMHPDFFFRDATAEELAEIIPSSLQFPLVLKPTVGFFSVGVYVIDDAEGWRRAVADISAKAATWAREYPSEVVASGRFIVEEYIPGDEYALDVYYDDNGEAVIVNMMKHDFSSAEDVRDRLYYTSAAIIRDNLDRFTAYLNRLGEKLDLRAFPAHVEVRVSERGIIPIECNPLRFAGWCTTDLTWFAFGLRTYEYYLQNKRPDWDALLAGHENNIYSLVILDKPAGLAPNAAFDFEALGNDFGEVLCRRRMEFAESPIFGYLFTRTPEPAHSVLEHIVRADLGKYVVPV